MAEYSPAISLSQARDCSNTSEEDDNDDQSPRTKPPLVSGGGVSGGAGGGVSKSWINNSNNGKGSGDVGTTVETARKPRGRPPGSKNKPKPPIVITRDHESAMRPMVLEISAGSDLVEMVSQFARHRHLGLSVLSCSGTVANVTLHHPASHASTLTLHGPFHILSLSGTFLGFSSSSSSSSTKLSSSSAAAAVASSPFAISLAGGQGQVFGGIIAGKVIAANTVVLVVATFSNPSFHRLPGEDEEAAETKPSNVVGENESCTTTTIYSSVAAPAPLNCQLPSDVLPWAPTSRSPPY